VGGADCWISIILVRRMFAFWRGHGPNPGHSEPIRTPSSGVATHLPATVETGNRTPSAGSPESDGSNGGAGRPAHPGYVRKNATASDIGGWGFLLLMDSYHSGNTPPALLLLRIGAMLPVPAVIGTHRKLEP
jgi:hypothetical protein